MTVISPAFFLVHGGEREVDLLFPSPSSAKKYNIWEDASMLEREKFYRDILP